MKQLTLSIYLLVTFFTTGISAQQKVVVSIGEYPPYISQHLKHYGVTARIIQEAFALQGIEVEYKFTNWARAFKLVHLGESDAMGPILKNTKREEHYYFSDSLLFETQVFFHRSDFAFEWQNIKDLAGIEIGVVIAYSYGKLFDNAVKQGKLQVQTVRSDKQNINKLLSQRIQLFPQSLDVGYYLLQTEFADNKVNMTHHPKFINQSDNYLAFSRNNPNSKVLIKKFNRGLATLKRNGKYDLYFAESRRGDYNLK